MVGGAQAVRAASKFDLDRDLRWSLRNQQRAATACEKLPAYQTQRRESRQPNLEIRRTLRFLSFALLAPFCCLASSVLNHLQKRRNMFVLQALLQHLWPVFSYFPKSVLLALSLFRIREILWCHLRCIDRSLFGGRSFGF